MKDDVSLVEQTQRDILEYISKNNSNAQLPKEQEFVGLLGVSRVVVREALSRLRALGIIETKRKKERWLWCLRYSAGSRRSSCRGCLTAIRCATFINFV